MWSSRLPRLDILSEEQADTLHGAAMSLLEEIGVRFMYEPALERFRAAGVTVEGDLVRMDRGFVMEQLGLAPATFEVRGRNPERTIIPATATSAALTGGAPFVRPAVGRRPDRRGPRCLHGSRRSCHSSTNERDRRAL
jgi:trimethylamine--corrinoid protein Co-methyltransferase